MRALKLLSWLMVCLEFSTWGLQATLEGTFQKVDGTEIVGATINYKAEGVTFRYTEGPNAGHFTSRIPWEDFTIETLKFFLTDPETRGIYQVRMALPASEIDASVVEALERPKPPPVIISGDSRPGRPYAGIPMRSAMLGGGGLMLSLVLLLANLYAAYEIALFRRMPAVALCGASIFLPVIAPVVALCCPTMARRPRVVDTPVDDVELESDSVEIVEEFELADAVVVETASQAPVALPATQVFGRGQFNLNRRFIETKFAGFFRAVPGENERDMELVFVTGAFAVATRRILKATQSEIVIEAATEEGGMMEYAINLGEIEEVRLKHQDALE